MVNRSNLSNRLPTMTKFKYLFNYWAKYHQIKINLQTRPAQFIFHTFRLQNPRIADPITSFALIASEARRTLHLLHNAALLERSYFFCPRHILDNPSKLTYSQSPCNRLPLTISKKMPPKRRKDKGSPPSANTATGASKRKPRAPATSSKDIPLQTESPGSSPPSTPGLDAPSYSSPAADPTPIIIHR